jgi:hypothetical protein
MEEKSVTVEPSTWIRENEQDVPWDIKEPKNDFCSIESEPADVMLGS